MAGQGTIAVELLEQHPDIGLIVAPISGGGMVSGIAVAAKARTDGRVTVLAAECCGLNDAADAYQSKKAGRLVECAKPEVSEDTA